MSYRLDGNGDYLTTAAQFGNDNLISVVVWWRVPTGGDVSGNDRLLEWGGFNELAGIVSLEASGSGNGVNCVEWLTGNGNSQLGSTFTPTLDVWNCSIYTSDKTANNVSKFYTNGTQLGSSAADRALAAADFSLGGRNNDPTQNNPSVDVAEVSIHEGYLLTPSDVAAIWNGGAGAKITNVHAANLVGYWPLRNSLVDTIAANNLTAGGDAASIVAHPLAGEIVVAVGLATETDSAFSMTKAKLRAIGQPSEADSAQAMAVNGNVVFLDAPHARQLKDDHGAVHASETFDFAAYDNVAAPVLGNALAVQTGTFTTDASGQARAHIPGTALAAGASVALCVRSQADPNDFAWLQVPLGP